MGQTARMPMRRSCSTVFSALVITAVAVLAAAACSSSTTASGPGTSAATGGGTTAPTTTVNPYPKDATLKLNDLQALGGHNSYHLRTPPEFRAALEKLLPGVTKLWDYEHAPLDQQFTNDGVRQIELDVHLDPDGRYATRHAMPLAQLPADAPAEMKQPGLKVFHVQELDFASNCLTFVACLQTVKQWSDANPGHAPIMILVEAKEDKLPDIMSFTQPVPFDAAGLGQIDTEIRSVFNDSQLITPDQVRGSYKTLEEAVLADNWPTLGQSRGKLMFTLDNGDKRQLYAEGHPSLQGRVMFTDAEPGEPEAAFVERNDAKEKQAEITDLVKKGYVVRTRSDGDTKEARENDMSSAQAALASGAQWISTDYAVVDPTVSATFVVAIPGGTPARCNPVTAPAGCESTDIENPKALT